MRLVQELGRDDQPKMPVSGMAIKPKQQRLNEVRVLMYSHDTFGLGHLRRCRTIAHSLVENFKGVHVLIISGSQIAGAFDFKARVDFVKIPSVIKLYNGEYTSISKHIDIHETLNWRKAIIQSTAESFDPDILIVDKEPIGLRGELLPTLHLLKNRGCRLILGLREVMDEATALHREWARHDVMAHVKTYFDDIWIYGPKGFYNPLAGLPLPAKIMNRLSYTGFLRREISQEKLTGIEDLPDDYILVTTGGGGDGAPLFKAVLAAHALDWEHRKNLLIVLGPFMLTKDREDIRRIATGLSQVTIIDFHNRHEVLMARASAVVSMAGYNTFCEILSLNKRALLVPRVKPRQEQMIRAQRAAALGLVDVLLPEEADNPVVLARQLRHLTMRALPHDCGAGPMLDGLGRICDLMRETFAQSGHNDVFVPPAAE